MPRLPLLQDPRYAEIIQHSRQYEHVTGEQGFIYPSNPGGPGEPMRFVFGARVALGIRAALTYARLLGAYAEEKEREAARQAARAHQHHPDDPYEWHYMSDPYATKEDQG